MPAATPKNELLLPRIPRPDPVTSPFREVERMVDAPTPSSCSTTRVRSNTRPARRRAHRGTPGRGFYGHATITPGARLELPWRADFSALAYVLSGRGAAGPSGRPVREGQLAVC